MAVSSRILALGGAEFDARPQNVAIQAYILEQVGVAEPRICLLPTASGDPSNQIASFHSAFEARGAKTSHISLFRLGDRPVELRKHLLAQDAVYVGGGSLVNLLALWRAHGLDEIMREVLAAGVFVAGHSAGAMCWFEGGITRSHGAPSTASGLGLLAGTACPHYDCDEERAGAYRAAIEGGFAPGIALDDHAGALYIGGRLVEVVAGRAAAQAHWVGGEQARLPVRRLTAPQRFRDDDDLAEFRRVAALRVGQLPRFAAQ